MLDWFDWNGRRCTDFGVHVTEQPHPAVPSERVTFVDVPGRPGSLTKLEGEDVYDDLVMTASCIISDPSRIPEIAAYLKGSGKVTFANRQGGFYYARIVNQISFEKILRGNPHRGFAVNFRCKPFWYMEGTQPITLTTSGTSIINPGSVFSEPVITVYGTGEITLMAGITIVELSEVSGSITLDSGLQEAHSGSVSLNHRMSGDFPVLRPGSNAISWSGNVSQMTIQPNWRCL